MITLDSLQARALSTGELRQIDTDSLVRFAYRSNERLRKEYVSEELFVAHWVGIRRQYKLLVPAESAFPLEQQIRGEWNRTPALRAEFKDSFESYAAYLQAERRGVVRIASNRTIEGG